MKFQVIIGDFCDSILVIFERSETWSVFIKFENYYLVCPRSSPSVPKIQNYMFLDVVRAIFGLENCDFGSTENILEIFVRIWLLIRNECRSDFEAAPQGSQGLFTIS